MFDFLEVWLLGRLGREDEWDVVGSTFGGIAFRTFGRMGRGTLEVLLLGGFGRWDEWDAAKKYF